MLKFPITYGHTYPSISRLSSALPSPLHSFHNHANWNNCCGKKKPAIKYGCGENAAIFASWISSIFGEENIPYCWAAKSYAKERGARTRRVEGEAPIAEINTPFLKIYAERIVCRNLRGARNYLGINRVYTRTLGFNVLYRQKGWAGSSCFLLSRRVHLSCTSW